MHFYGFGGKIRFMGLAENFVFAVSARKCFLRFWPENAFWSFGGNMHFLDFGGKMHFFFVLTGKCVFFVLVEKCGFTGLAKKCVFMKNVRFMFFCGKMHLAVLEGKYVFQFLRKNAFFVIAEKYICKKIEFTV